MKLIKKIILQGRIELMTGLHIGGTNNAMSIGGVDKTVIRNPLDNRPIIPGSSLKGKMRTLLEVAYGKFGGRVTDVVQHGPNHDPDFWSGKLFGTAPSQDKEHRQRPSRVLVRDANLIVDDEWEARFSNTDLPYTEAKTEVVLDRITAKASLRQNERVPAGAEFKLEMVLNIFDGDPDPEEDLLKTLFRCMAMLQDDYLGGNGSRGYGKIKFHVGRIMERSRDFYLGKEEEKDYGGPVPEELR